MKTYAIATAAALFAGMIAPTYAFDGAAGLRAPSQVTRITCDTRNEDEQAVCASKCEDAYLKDTMSFTADIPKIKSAKKECDAKCGCPQNTKN